MFAIMTVQPRALVLPAFLILLGSTASGAGYQIQDLGDLGGGFARARAINASGLIVGESLLPVVGTVENAFEWDRGKLSELGTLGGLKSRALDVNDAGVISGWAQDASINTTPVLWANQGIVSLATLGGSKGVAWAVNNSQVAAGHSFLNAGAYHATLWDIQGQASDLGTLGGNFSIGYDLNSAGIVVGAADKESGVQDACLWGANGIVDLGTLSSGLWNTARAINDLGQIILWGIPSHGASNHAAFWNGEADSQVFDLGTFGGSESWAYGLNNLGYVVGSADLSAGNYHAFLWNSESMTDLGTLGGLFSAAYGINDNGVVVGFAQDENGVTHAVRWMPVPEPPFLRLSLYGCIYLIIHFRIGRSRI